MKRYLILISLVQALSGCAVLTGASAVSLATTGKTIGDTAASLVTQADCNAWRASIELTYYCEYPREPGTTYTRTSF